MRTGHPWRLDFVLGGGGLVLSATAINASQSLPPWVSGKRNVAGATTPIAINNLLEGNLVNIAGLTINASAICNSKMSLRYLLTADGPAQIRLSEGRQISLPAASEYRAVLTASAAHEGNG